MSFDSVFTQRLPEAPIALTATGLVTHQQWQLAVTALTHRLNQSAGNEVAIFADNALDFSIALFASIAAGKVALVPGNNTPNTQQLMQSRGAELLGNWSDSNVIAIYLDDLLTASSDQRTKAPQPLPSDAVIVVFTSGSTGEPKAIEKQLWHFETEIEALQHSFLSNQTMLPNTSLIAGTVSHQHIYGMIFRVLMPLKTGHIFLSEQQLDAAQILKLATTSGYPTAWVASPAHLKRLPDNLPWTDAARALQDIYSSGGPLDSDTARHLQQVYGKSALEIFGSSETGGVAARRQYATGDGFNDLWQPLHGVTAQCADDGRLTIQSRHLSDAPYAMDDQIQLHSDGRFQLMGRLDRIVKLEEKRLSLIEMEIAINSSDCIQESACRVLESASRDQLCCVAVLTTAGTERLHTLGKRALINQLKSALLNQFELSLLPRKWRFVDQLPINAQSKIDRQCFEQLFE